MTNVGSAWVDVMVGTLPTPESTVLQSPVLGPPSLMPQPSLTDTPMELGPAESYPPLIERFITGPAVAGLGALGAALLVLRGTNKTVARAKEANDETARKNEEDQWWSTLQWAYEQASNTDSSSSSDFREKAVLGIFESLAATPELSPTRLAALENIKSVFKEKEGDANSAELQNLARALEAQRSGVAPLGLRQTRDSLSYRRRFTDEMRPVAKKLELTQVYAHQQGAPVLFRTADGTLLGLMPMYFDPTGDSSVSNPRVVARQLAERLRGREFMVSSEPGGLGEGRTQEIDVFAVVTNAPGYWPTSEAVTSDPPCIFYPDPVKPNNPRSPMEHYIQDRDNPWTEEGTERMERLVSSVGDLIKGL